MDNTSNTAQGGAPRATYPHTYPTPTRALRLAESISDEGIIGRGCLQVVLCHVRLPHFLPSSTPSKLNQSAMAAVRRGRRRV